MSLRALTLIQPMASAIVIDHPLRKDIENRKKSMLKEMVGVSTVVAVHAGIKFDHAYNDKVMDILGNVLPNPLPCGAIVGLMRLSGKTFTAENPPPLLPKWQGVSPWFVGPLGYEISDAIALPNPIKCEGMLNWWKVNDELQTQIWSQVPERWRPGLDM